MLQEICDAIWSEAKRVVTRQREIDAGELMHETLTSATMIAVATTGINAASRGYGAAEFVSATRLLPDFPQALADLTDEEPLPRTVRDALASLRRLHGAANVARTTLASPLDATTWRERQSRLARARTVLQGLCGFALSAVAEVESATEQLGLPVDLRLPNVALILKSARDGGLPCLDHDDRLAVPNWLQRRAQQRWTVRFPVDVVSNRSADVATALDISVNGLGIACLGSFDAGDAVTLRVPDGRILSGFIAWRHMRRAGIRFDCPLDASDPLLGIRYRVLERRF